MENRSRKQEIADIALAMHDVAAELVGNESTLPLEEVGTSRPLTRRELIGLKRPLPPIIKVEGVRFAVGVKDMEAVVFRQGDQFMIAAKITRLLNIRKDRADYWTFTINGYIEWLLLDRDHLSRAKIALAMMTMSKSAKTHP
jgi:hypothetical protein